MTKGVSEGVEITDLVLAKIKSTLQIIQLSGLLQSSKSSYNTEHPLLILL